MAFTYPEALDLTRRPTPIEPLERLSQQLEGPALYVKRDDLTGMALSGNKVRKLNFLLAEAKKGGHNVVITCGGMQSNHARATAVAAAKLGLKCHLVLRNSVPGGIDGNLFLDRLVGAEAEFISQEAYAHVDGIMTRLAEDLRAQGHNPYIIPEGGSNPLGVVGYIQTAEEIAEQSRALGIRFDHIVVAVGSGGTQAGLLLGKHLFDLSGEIHGISVCDPVDHCADGIGRLCRQAAERFGLEFKIGKRDIRVLDYIGKGYGLSSQEEITTIKRVAQTEGIILDPAYTGKAMYGLIREIRQQRFKPGERVLFIHTGGIFGLFPKRNLFF